MIYGRAHGMTRLDWNFSSKSTNHQLEDHLLNAMNLPWLTINLQLLTRHLWLLIDSYIVTYIKPTCSMLAMGVGPLINTRDMAPHFEPWLIIRK